MAPLGPISLSPLFFSFLLSVMHQTWKAIAERKEQQLYRHQLAQPNSVLTWKVYLEAIRLQEEEKLRSIAPFIKR